MLTREQANLIQAEWLTGTDMRQSAIVQFEAMIRAALILTRVQIAMANAGKLHWDFADGLADAITAADDTEKVSDGQYAAGYLEEFRAMWASYTVWLATPITATGDGAPVTLDKKPLDIIMSTPTIGLVGGGE